MDNLTEEQIRAKARHHRWAIAFVVGLALLGYVLAVAVSRAREDALASEARVWRLTYRIDFKPDQQGARLQVALPDQSPGNHIFREVFSQLGGTLHVQTSYTEEGREALAVAAHDANEVRFVAQFDLRLDPSGKKLRWTLLDKVEEESCLRSTKLVQHDSPEVKEVLRGLRASKRQGVELADVFYRYCARKIQPGDGDSASDASSVLRRGQGTSKGRARAMVALCRARKLPARIVAGFVLDRESTAEPHAWVQVHVDGRWYSYDPDRGYAREVPENYVAVRYNAFEIVRVSGAEANTHYSIRTLPDEGHLASIIDLTRMPPDMQEAVSHMLLLPVAVLITAIFRNLIGVETFTAFGPGLLAMTFLFADWLSALAVFGSVMVIGLGSRAILARMSLSKGPRLGVLLVLSVWALTLAVSTLDYFGLTPSSRGVVLPMVVLTMMVERYYVRADQDGPWKAIRVLAGSVGVGILCVPILKFPGFADFILAFPELLFVVAAALVLVGRYKGTRLIPRLWAEYGNWRERSPEALPTAEDSPELSFRFETRGQVTEQPKGAAKSPSFAPE